MATPAALKRTYERLLAYALTKPETKVDYPWGHAAVKVAKKTFVFLSNDDGLSVSTKLPHSNEAALHFPFAEATHYGLGKSGWVTAWFEKGGEALPVEILERWIDESYAAIAPKRVLAQATMGAPPTQPKRRRKG